jgi:heme/copper-type cytochrome/quinol oxidase subunit 3
MSTTALRAHALPIDDSRGTLGMWLFIASEALVFVCLFFAYFYVGHRHPEWPLHPPKLLKALSMLVILLASSATLHASEQRLKHRDAGSARGFLALTIVLGFIFVGVQISEYRERLLELKPVQNAYGSVFYTLTSFHAAHLGIGLLMLIFALLLPRLEPREHSPHRPLHNTALYWHFVDVIWALIVALIYVLPHFTRSIR